MARITRMVPGNPDDDNNGKPPGEKVVELSDVDGHTIEVYDQGQTYCLKLIGKDGDYRYADFDPLTLQTLALRILAHLNKQNRN